LNNNIN